MLTTILGQVTRFFDRRAIVSGFAPSALFWTLVLVALTGATRGFQGSLDWWKGQSGTAQALLLAGYVAWLVIFGVLTVNWQVALVRLFEGYWPDSRLWRRVDERFRKRSRDRWKELDERDRKLEEAEIAAREAGSAEVGRAAARRLALSRQLVIYFPSSVEDVMPTRLGNVIRSAELYSWERYRLDSVVVWPRLETTFENGLPDPVLDARTSVDLMVTLSAFSVLFGVPLATWLAVAVESALPWWAPLAVLVPGLLLALWASAAVAAVALGVGVLADSMARAGEELDRVALGLGVLAAVLLVAGLTYRNAVEAAVGYGERIKAVLDVHRWRVLDALKLPTPADLDQERALWNDVSALLYRGYRPESELYHYTGAAADPATAPESSPGLLARTLDAARHWARRCDQKRDDDSGRDADSA
jgi:hypothetical protein